MSDMLVARLLLFQIEDREINWKKIKSNILSVNVFQGIIFLTFAFLFEDIPAHLDFPLFG